MLGAVASSISEYLLKTNVQMANYSLAKQAETKVSMGNCAAAALLGAESVDDVMIGQSATSLVASVAFMIENKVLADRENGEGKEREKGWWAEGDEVVISDADHETNRGAWVRMAKKLGMVVKDWAVTSDPSTTTNNDSKLGGENEYDVTLNPETLLDIVTPRTRLVAFTACSNLLGAFTNIPAATKTIRSIAPHAIVVVDCVAFAPHRRITPIEWDVDIAFFSLYKTYGAHVGAMYISPVVKQTRLQRLNHFFLQPPTAEIAGMYPYQTSSVQYELNHSISAVGDYMVALGLGKIGGEGGERFRVDWNHVFSRPSPSNHDGSEQLVKMSRAEIDAALDRAFAKIQSHENKLLSRFIPFLLQPDLFAKGLRIVGPQSSSASVRAPTIAFAIVTPHLSSTESKHSQRVGTSKQIHSLLVQNAQIGAQQGHMYAHKLVQSLGLDLGDGVVRLSFVHYNTEQDVKRSIDLLQTVFDQVL